MRSVWIGIRSSVEEAIRGAGYDAEGRRITSSDQVGRITTSVYDAVGRVTDTIFPDLTRTHTDYDAAKQLVKE